MEITEDHRTCRICSVIKPLLEFGIHRRYKGVLYRRHVCKDCYLDINKDYWREYRKRTRDTTKPYENSRICHPERYQARQEVLKATKRGDMPRAAELLCVDCGIEANQYDHYLGYTTEHQLDVQPICLTCHELRERRRNRDGREQIAAL